MTKYTNPRIEAEMREAELETQEEALMQEEATTVEEEIWKKRYSDLRRHQQTKEAEIKGEIDALKNQLQQALTGKIRMPKSEEEVDAWTKEYPEFRSILDTIITKAVKDSQKDVKSDLERIKERQIELEKEEAFLELRKRHPDFESVVRDPDFKTWLAKQSQRVQDAIIKNLDVDDADFVLSKYKDQAKKKKPSAKAEDDDFNKGAARAVSPRDGSKLPDSLEGDYVFSESQIQALSRQDKNWFAKNEEKIMAAHRQGKILMDLTGGAR